MRALDNHLAFTSFIISFQNYIFFPSLSLSLSLLSNILLSSESSAANERCVRVHRNAKRRTVSWTQRPTCQTKENHHTKQEKRTFDQWKFDSCWTHSLRALNNYLIRCVCALCLVQPTSTLPIQLLFCYFPLIVFTRLLQLLRGSYAQQSISMRPYVVLSTFFQFTLPSWCVDWIVLSSCRRMCAIGIVCVGGVDHIASHINQDKQLVYYTVSLSSTRTQ